MSLPLKCATLFDLNNDLCGIPCRATNSTQFRNAGFSRCVVDYFSLRIPRILVS